MRRCAVSRLDSSTESRSGASSSAMPRGTASSEATVTSASTGWCASSSASAGLCTSTGRLVVGRSTPAAVTSAPTRELTSVDFPAPVDPDSTTTAGADSSVSRGMRCSVSWSTRRARDARADATSSSSSGNEVSSTSRRRSLIASRRDVAASGRSSTDAGSSLRCRAWSTVAADGSDPLTGSLSWRMADQAKHGADGVAARDDRPTEKGVTRATARWCGGPTATNNRAPEMGLAPPRPRGAVRDPSHPTRSTVMNPQIAFELAVLEHVARVEETRRELRRRRLARRRPRWHAFWRPPSGRDSQALAA